MLPEDGIGPGGDITFRGHSPRGSYRLFVGDKLFGVVSYLGRTWHGVSLAAASEFFGVRQLEGFATRLDAAGFVIRHHGYWMRNERKSRAITTTMDERMNPASGVRRGVEGRS